MFYNPFQWLKHLAYSVTTILRNENVIRSIERIAQAILSNLVELSSGMFCSLADESTVPQRRNIQVVMHCNYDTTPTLKQAFCVLPACTKDWDILAGVPSFSLQMYYLPFRPGFYVALYIIHEWVCFVTFRYA